MFGIKICSFPLMFAICSQIWPSLENGNRVKFLFYSSPFGQGEEIFYKSNYNYHGIRQGAQTTLIIDGFLSHGATPMSQITKDALLRSRWYAQNVIVVDWGAFSGSGTQGLKGNLLKTSATYVQALKNVGSVGKTVADFIHYLSRVYRIPPSKFHIIGHSLGAHIAGASGLWMKRLYGTKIGHISGLDPAGPLFSGGFNPNKRLSSQDADFVDIYHTNRERLGDRDHGIGDIDVYVNGGSRQPGCSEAACSHSYSWKFYISTFFREMRACPCSGFECQCQSNCRVDYCRNSVPIGSNVSWRNRGAFHVNIQERLQ